MSSEADHSVTGQLGDMADGAIWGAAGGLFGAGAGRIASKILGKCHSFLPGTGVLLSDGTRKAIQDVKVGDLVVTTDVETGKTAEKSVASTITTEGDKEFTDITIRVGSGYSSITATDTHPFWVPELDKWVKAQDLQVGQWLRTSAGTHVQVTALSAYTRPQRTHDLSIQDVHAYYVLAGATPVLVHNCGLAEEMGSGNIWKSSAELSAATGKTAASRNRAISAIISEDFPNLNLTHRPVYSYGVNSGMAKANVGTQIGFKRFESRALLRNTVVHEELHHRWFARGLSNHHPRDGSGTSKRFYGIVDRYTSMRGWQ